ncbi:MAG TPA: aminotransferase class V-fold PLP-dependent enzyme [Acidimicrobiia bacterium]
MGLPREGLGHDDVLTRLEAMRADDVDWRGGRCFSLVYDGGDDVRAVARAAHDLYLSENALNTNAFPSLGRMQADVVRAVADLTHGGDDSAGFMTSGGTESILVAVKAAKERGRAERGVTEPEMVVARSAHAAFHKAARDFGVTARVIDVRDDWRADVDAMAAAVNERTVLVVGSAPQYPQGVIDPIPEIAMLATDAGASCHVDACMGGFVLPFAERLGRDVAPWDFRVPGVTSISADVHKLGYAPKGASVIVHRTKTLRKYQTFVFDDWLGGLYASPNLLGTRAGGPIAAAWAVIHYLGEAGYLRLTATALDAAARLVAGIDSTPALAVRGVPDAQIVCFGAADPETLDVFALGDALAARGWYLDRQGPPDSLHATVSAGNAPMIDALLADLRELAPAVRGAGAAGGGTDYATLE